MKKTKSNTSSYYLKNQVFNIQENSLWFFYFRQRITVGKRKTKTIQTDLGTCRHNQAYPVVYLEPWHIHNPGIFTTLVYSQPWHIHNPDIFRILAYSQPRYIQNPGIFRALGYSKSEIYSGTCQTSSMSVLGKLSYFHQEFPQIIIIFTI